MVFRPFGRARRPLSPFPRIREPAWKDLDVVEGGIANDRVFNTIELFAAGLTPREDTLKKLRYERPNNQICILDQSILDRFLRFVEAIELP